MRELSGMSLAGNDAILDFGETGESRAEILIGLVLSWAIRLWCLPFLLVAWGLAWGALVVIRSATWVDALFRPLSGYPIHDGSAAR